MPIQATSQASNERDLVSGSSPFRVHVFSPSAMHSSLEALAAAHRDASGVEVSLAFEIAPAFRKRLEGGEKADVLIAPPPVMDELVQIGKAQAADRFELGRVGAGVVVRKGAPVPDVSSTAALVSALREAESVVYNFASSGTVRRRNSSRSSVSRMRLRTRRRACAMHRSRSRICCTGRVARSDSAASPRLPAGATEGWCSSVRCRPRSRTSHRISQRSLRRPQTSKAGKRFSRS